MQERERVELSLFDRKITERERACFEAGIALGTICHQFSGMPISNDRKVIKAVESAIEKSCMLQPYRERVSVKIRASKESAYGYTSLKEEDMEIEVQVRYKNARVVARMQYVDEINYPLMYIKSLE